MILIVIGLLILIYSFYDFKKAYYAFIFYSIFWAPNAICFTIGEKDIILNLIMSFGFLISFILNYKKLNKTKKLMPFTIPFVLIILSMFLTCFFSKGGFYSEFTRFISKIFQTYTTIFISWYVFETKEDYKKLIRLIIVAFFIAGIYGLIEFIIQKNYFLDYKRIISPNIYSTYNTARRGYRIVSIFDHSLGAGINFGLVCAFILYLYIYEKDILTYKKISIITAIICFINVILTKSRGDYLFLLIALIPCFNPKRVNLKKVLMIILIIFTISIPFTYKRLNIITSIFDDDAQSQIKGSSIQLRVEQYFAAKEAVTESPIFGLGEKYPEYISLELKEKIKGAESIWLEQLLKHGIVGVITNIVFTIFSIVIIPYKYKSKRLLFLSLAYWITYSITTFLGFRFDLFYCILFYYIKSSKCYSL